MFIGLVTVRIEKDSNAMKYIKIIRNYDNTLPLGQIKKAIDTGDVVFTFDSKNNGLIANGNDSSLHSREYYFIKTLKELKKAGAKMTVVEEEWGRVCDEFSAAPKKAKKQSFPKTQDNVMAKIKEKWNLPQGYLDYLTDHPESQSIEIEDEETLNRIYITLYGANDLISCQDGYSYNPVEKKPIEDWDKNLVVIADTEADPFCIDISQENSPVLYAMHGMDEWDFDDYSDSLEEFLELLLE